MTDPYRHPGTRPQTGPQQYPPTLQGGVPADPGYYGPPQDPYGGPPAPNRTPLILAIVAVIVALAAAGALVYLFTRSDDQPVAAGPSSAPQAVVTVTDDRPEPSTTTTTVTRQTVTTTVPVPAPDAVTVAGADGHGFLDGPRCNAAEDPVVFVGRTARSRVIVCQVGAQVGRDYYKGLADGNAIEIGYPRRSGSTFVAENGPVRYTVSPTALVITRDGTTLANEPMLEAWVD